MGIESSLIWVIYLAMGSIFALFLNVSGTWTGWRSRLETSCALFVVVFCAFLGE
jgi:hypothetical protein